MFQKQIHQIPKTTLLDGRLIKVDGVVGNKSLIHHLTSSELAHGGSSERK